jgi:hypothetical protein
VKHLLLVLLVLVPPASPAGMNLSGTWTMTTDFFSESGRVSAAKFAIRQQDRLLSVQFVHGAEMTGAVEHRRAEWHWQNADVLFTFSAVVAETGNTMRGTWRVRFKDDGSERNGTFSAVKTP